MKMKKTKRRYVSYIEKEYKPRNIKLESFIIGFQNVYYIVSSWLFGYLFAQTRNVVFLLIILVPILIKIGYNPHKKKVVVRIIR